MAASVKADKNVMGLRRLSSVLAVAVVTVLVSAPSASAYPWPKLLQEGDTGREVKALQVRVAGWFPDADQNLFEIDGVFDADTKVALERFQEHYELKVDGIAGPKTFEALDALEDEDHTTIHFDFSEFWQNHNSGCSDKANRHAGTFQGGMVSEKEVKKNVRRLMWRLEALRAKLGDNPIAINSGFRSIAYNRCINGATYSQHMYGTAADLRIVDVSNRAGRDTAKESQVHGIGCYSTLSHNHLDLRMQNESLGGAQYWWWPERDRYERDLAADKRPCYGEVKQTSGSASGASISSDLDLYLWTRAELDRWKAAGEEADLHGLD